MSNYNSLKATIDANIKQNGNQEITGQILNSVLNQMVNILGAGYQFAGVATIATNPGTPDAKVFYIANGKGTYEKFGGINVTEDDVVVLYWDSSWHKVSTGIASQAKLSELDQEIFIKKYSSNLNSGYVVGSLNANGTINETNTGRVVLNPIKVENKNTYYFLYGTSQTSSISPLGIIRCIGFDIEGNIIDNITGSVSYTPSANVNEFRVCIDRKFIDQFFHVSTSPTTQYEEYYERRINKWNTDETLGYYTPQMFGAIGDGENDDTQAIQECLNQSYLIGKSIFFPAGIYKVTSPLTILYKEINGVPQRGKIQKIYGCGNQPFSRISDSSVIIGYNIPQYRGVLELLGQSNSSAISCQVEDIAICQAHNCHENSFCLFYGDSVHFECSHVTFRGWNDVLARSGSVLPKVSDSYANINTLFRQCIFTTFSDPNYVSKKGFAFLPEGVITGISGMCDNIRFEGCLIQALCVINCCMFSLVSSHIAIPMDREKSTTDNIGALHGYSIDYSTGFLFIRWEVVHIDNLYTESYRRAIEFKPLYLHSGNAEISNCYFNAESNYDAEPGDREYEEGKHNRKRADCAIMVSAGRGNYKVQNLYVHDCVARVYRNESGVEYEKPFHIGAIATSSNLLSKVEERNVAENLKGSWISIDIPYNV